MTNTNTALWNELKKTDPKATKPFKKGGGFTGTQIDPVWRAQRMTEVFGPIGKGWGYDITERWSEEFKTKDGTVCVVYVTVNAWYTDPETKEKLFTGPQIGGTEVGRAADEAYKMAVTDALTKCLVNVGLCADVYLGLFDDSKYRDAVAAEYEGKRREQEGPKPFDTGAFTAKDAKSWAAEFRRRIDLAPSVEALNAFLLNCAPTLKQIEKDDPDTYEALKSGVSNRRHTLAPAVAAE